MSTSPGDQILMNEDAELPNWAWCSSPARSESQQSSDVLPSSAWNRVCVSRTKAVHRRLSKSFLGKTCMSTPGVLVFFVQLTLFGPSAAQYRHPHASTCQILTTRRARFTSCDVTRILIRRQNLSPCRAANVAFRARKKDRNIIFKVAETVSMKRLCIELHICSQFDSSLISLQWHFNTSFTLLSITLSVPVSTLLLTAGYTATAL